LVDVNGAELLPQDDVAQGFDNIASALQFAFFSLSNTSVPP